MNDLQQVVSESIDLELPNEKEPRAILAQWTLELIKKAELQTHWDGPQKLLFVQTALLALLQKHHSIFESSSLQKLFVTDEVPLIVSTAIRLSKEPLFRKRYSWSCCF